MVDAKKAEEMYVTAKYACRMIMNLINDMLDQAKLENNAFTFYNQYFDLLELIRQAINIIEPQSNKKFISFEVIFHD